MRYIWVLALLLAGCGDSTPPPPTYTPAEWNLDETVSAEQLKQAYNQVLGNKIHATEQTNPERTQVKLTSIANPDGSTVVIVRFENPHLCQNNLCPIAITEPDPASWLKWTILETDQATPNVLVSSEISNNRFVFFTRDFENRWVRWTWEENEYGYGYNPWRTDPILPPESPNP